MNADGPIRDISDEDAAQIAALADGTLPEERRGVLEQRLAASPALRALLAEQERVVSAARALGDAAPARLRAAVADRRQRGRKVRRRWAGGAAAGLAAAAAAVALIVAPTERPAPAPSLVAATGLALRPATLPAPAPYRRHPVVLRLEVQGLPYPNWELRFGWRAAGARRDRIAGRAATTLFYAKAGRRIAYTIVSRPALALGRPAAITSRDGVELRTFALRGRVLVTWRRRGHTCVLSGRHVPLGTLLALGAWRAGGAIPY